ncbi:MAG: hypothetical protein N4A33_05340 [Bacteriovoracaceae bacterium]|jgi:hypothetical protein|nr:hypothetical protein [Bacteriovoracaceae bacterium]
MLTDFNFLEQIDSSIDGIIHIEQTYLSYKSHHYTEINYIFDSLIAKSLMENTENKDICFFQTDSFDKKLNYIFLKINSFKDLSKLDQISQILDTTDNKRYLLLNYCKNLDEIEVKKHIKNYFNIGD